MNDLVLAQAAGPSPFGPIVVMAIIFAFFYFLVMRPQQQKERDKETFREALKRNDEVITTGGLYGKVVDLKGPIVVLELGSNMRVRIDRGSIESSATPARKKESREREK